ncbi:MAG: DUF3570 domain-containing protein [Lewinella sp.]
MDRFKYLLLAGFTLVSMTSFAQRTEGNTPAYKKRVLDATEVDILSSYYSQTGENAAVTGGVGTEELTDFTATYIISIPLNDDDVLTIDAGISAYSSASSSNVDPFDEGPADPFQASSGASSSDVWASVAGSYSHSSDDRNTIWSLNASLATEYDYFSVGLGGAFTKLFNEKNTELSISGNVFLDSWTTIYPFELRPFGEGGSSLNDALFSENTITGSTNYSPTFNEFENTGRNSYSLGIGFSQILHKNVQASVSLDLVQQQGLLATPFQRVNFGDVADAFIDNFQLADANELLPDNRFKTAIGGRLNWYLNQSVALRTYYRYYSDDWGVTSHTASIEVPVKISPRFTVYPSYRFYNQTAADHFKPHETALSTDEFYTADFGLSEFSANQYGFGVSYTDIFTSTHIGKWGLKSVDLKFYQYDRNTTFSSSIFTLGVKFVKD